MASWREILTTVMSDKTAPLTHEEIYAAVDAAGLRPDDPLLRRHVYHAIKDELRTSSPIIQVVNTSPKKSYALVSGAVLPGPLAVPALSPAVVLPAAAPPVATTASFTIVEAAVFVLMRDHGYRSIQQIVASIEDLRLPVQGDRSKLTASVKSKLYDAHQRADVPITKNGSRYIYEANLDRDGLGAQLTARYESLLTPARSLEPLKSSRLEPAQVKGPQPDASPLVVGRSWSLASAREYASARRLPVTYQLDDLAGTKLKSGLADSLLDLLADIDTAYPTCARVSWCEADIAAAELAEATDPAARHLLAITATVRAADGVQWQPEKYALVTDPLDCQAIQQTIEQLRRAICLG